MVSDLLFDKILTPLKVDPLDFRQIYDLTRLPDLEVAEYFCICYYEVCFEESGSHRYFVSIADGGAFVALKQIFALRDPSYYTFTKSKLGDIEVVERFTGSSFSVKFNAENYFNADKQALDAIKESIKVKSLFSKDRTAETLRKPKVSAGDGSW